MNQDPNQWLVQAMLGNTPPDQGQLQTMIEQMVARRSAEDPRMGMILNLITQRQAAAQAQAGEDVQEGGVNYQASPVGNPRAQYREHLQKLKEKVAAVYLELREMRNRNEMLALALGACKECWGRDPDCPSCLGQGKPGAYTVDPLLFEQFVEPACSQAHPPAGPKPSAGSNGRADKPSE